MRPGSGWAAWRRPSSVTSSRPIDSGRPPRDPSHRDASVATCLGSPDREQHPANPQPPRPRKAGARTSRPANSARGSGTSSPLVQRVSPMCPVYLLPMCPVRTNPICTVDPSPGALGRRKTGSTRNRNAGGNAPPAPRKARPRARRAPRPGHPHGFRFGPPSHQHGDATRAPQHPSTPAPPL
jgi:hypothetical protein